MGLRQRWTLVCVCKWIRKYAVCQPRRPFANGEDKDQASWSTVAKRRRGHRRDVLQHDTFQQSVVAAVYVDQTVKKHRETSIIVSGLSSNESAPDSELFTALCITEFHFKPEIASTKRLGRRQSDKISAAAGIPEARRTSQAARSQCQAAASVVRSGHP
jgi:hypothetical protein